MRYKKPILKKINLSKTELGCAYGYLVGWGQ